uniref:Cuticular protein CPG29 n=1 Tax=Papilio xuthus TaxID=66420 RepID=B2DBK9_PAPXU|nr:glycine-rich cell wall structural protein-like precursor [Papilio xuthus]BAG30768.1 cuticular protein CPG29 [Papilio xuthus]
MNSIVFVVVLASLCQAITKETEEIAHTRVPRTLLLKKKLCFVLGLCGGGGGQHGGGGHYNGGYGYQNQQGGYPPINIGISQSQSSANAGGGGLGTGYYPNNYQYNGGYPNRGGYDSYGRPGYFGNGYGANNNQFNGNYYGGNRYPNDGYRGSFGNYYDEGEDTKPIYEDTNENGPNYNGYGRDEGYRSNQ